jgi:lysophospholipase L1-like esterase
MRILNSLLSALLVTLLLSSFTDNASAQGVNPEALGSSIIRDVNGDGEVSILAVGDSITRGRGDFIGVGEDIEVTPAPGAEEAGYPLRIELLVGVSVLNRGISGQQLIADELPRFASTVPSASADIVIIGGGSNDAIFRALGTDIFKAVQTMINIAHASGVEPMLTTIPPTCCERAALNTFIDDYNLKLLDLAYCRCTQRFC